MRQRRKVVSVLSACILIAGAFAVVRLADFFGLQYRLRRAVQALAPTARRTAPIPTPKAQAPAPAPTSQAPQWCTVSEAPIDPITPLSPTQGRPISLATGYLEGSLPTYAPDGREIAFVKDRHVWIMHVSGRNLRQLTTDMNPDPVLSSFDSSPAWSPDGSRIAFASTGVTGTSDIWLVRPDGSDLTQLTTDQAVDGEPAWSPDGAQIAFVSSRAGTSDIWIMNADGSGLRRATNHPHHPSHPSFSSDGRQIAFSLTVYSMNIAAQCLMIVNVDGTGLRQFTTAAFRTLSPSWGARGILFQSGRDPTGLTVGWLIQPDGSGLQAIPNAVGEDMTWSPDGTRVAFSSHGNIYEFEFPDGAIRPLGQLQGYFIAIDIMPGRFPNAINLASATRIPVAILSAPGFEPVWEIDQTSITFGPTGNERRPVSCVEQEANQDRVTDLVCQFDVAAGFSPAHTEGILRAVDVDGIPLEGRDAVSVLGRP